MLTSKGEEAGHPSALPGLIDSELSWALEVLCDVTAACHSSYQIVSHACFATVSSALNPRTLPPNSVCPVSFPGRLWSIPVVSGFSKAHETRFPFPGHSLFCLAYSKPLSRGARVAQSVEHPTWAQVMISRFVGSSPASGLWADSSKPGAYFRFCASLSLCPSPTCACTRALSLFLSLKSI